MVLHDTEPQMTPLVVGRPVIVGRKLPSDVRIADERLSRRHARFSLQEDQRTVLVEDLGSKNGTWIGGKRIRGEVRTVLGEAVRLGRVTVQVEALCAPGSVRRAGVHVDGSFIAGAGMRAILDRIPLIADSSMSALLHGETGTGKEVIARLIHEKGRRRGKPFVPVNCGAIPPQLVESTLFGHERGAFTGATQQQKGVFEAADGGTVLLDEIGELPLPAQAALLRVLEAKVLTRVGSTREIAVDVRVLSATHRDLKAMGREGLFRIDLYYRLAVVVLEIRPLRARKDEIEPLALRFLTEQTKESGRRFRGIAPDALALLKSYSWPGNIRELKGAIEQAAMFAGADAIRAQDLPEEILACVAPQSARVAPQSARVASQGARIEILAPDESVTPSRDSSMSADAAVSTPLPGAKNRKLTDRPDSLRARPASKILPAAGDSEAVRPEAHSTGKILPNGGDEAVEHTPVDPLPEAGSGPEMRGQVHRYEAQLIIDALEAEGWKCCKAAQRLGIPRRTLSYRMNVLGIKADKR